MGVNVLTSESAAGDAARLAAAWAAPETFVYLPAKHDLPDDWLAGALARVPDGFHRHHFGLLTSGTTSRPKLLLGERGRAARLAGVLHDLQDSEPVRETIVALPLSYSFAFVNQWVWAAAHNRRLVPTQGFARPDEFRAALAAADRAMLCLVGVQVPLLFRYFSGESFPGVVRVHFAGGRFPQEHLAELARVFPSAEVFNNYGCAEAMPRLALRRAEESTEAAVVGRPLPGVELRAADGGRFEFRSAYGAVGVVEDGRFAPIAPDQWVPTGDLAEEAGAGLWRVTGRATEVFKRHGEKVSLPAFITSVLGVWGGAAAAYRETDRTGEDGFVLVVAPAPAPDDTRALLALLRTRYPRAAWPLRIESVGELPLLPNGKVDARGLPTAPGRATVWQQKV